MNTENEENRFSGNCAPLKQTASICSPGCACRPAGRSFRIRWIIGIAVLAAAGALAARVVIRNNQVPTAEDGDGFAVVATTTDAPIPPAETDTSVQEITAFSELNAVAVNTDAVFIFLPGKDAASGAIPAAPIQAAVKTIEARIGGKVGIFTLKSNAPEYAQLASQVSLPAVLAMVKGRGMNAVSGEITEAKLVQAFVSASSAGGCGPGASSGCCPR